MTPWFSLILPCYNVEKYVERCVQSILVQDYDDYEIILVDDGSTDHTPEICDTLAEMHSRIRVIHKENGGLSSARNTGLDAALGRYVWFIDSDDWVEQKALSQLHQVSCDGEPEIVKFAHYRLDVRTEFVPLNVENGLYQGRVEIEKLRRKAFCEAGRYCLSAWSHVYRKDFLATYHLRFVSERQVCSEDYLFNLQTLLHARSLRVISVALYDYEMREGSLTQTYKADLVERYSTLCQKLKQYYATADEEQVAGRLIDRFFVWHLVIGTGLTQEYSMLDAGHDVHMVRKAVRCVLQRSDVQAAVISSDRVGLRWQKKIQLLAMRLRFEGLFFWLYVIKPGKIRN